jgi:hypothetical protein
VYEQNSDYADNHRRVISELIIGSQDITQAGFTPGTVFKIEPY